MKKIKLLGNAALGAIAVTSFLLANNNNNQKNTNDLSLSNIEALHASAGGEMICDQKNDALCTIKLNDAVGTSTGYLVASWD